MRDPDLSGAEEVTLSELPGRLRAALDGVVAALSAAGQPGQQDAMLHAGKAQSADSERGLRAVFGYTVKVGLDGVRAEAFGDTAPSRPGKALAARTPITDVFEESAGYRIVAEIPGASADTVSCVASPDAVELSARSGVGYFKRVPLDRRIDPTSLTWRCANGILEACVEYAP